MSAISHRPRILCTPPSNASSQSRKLQRKYYTAVFSKRLDFCCCCKESVSWVTRRRSNAQKRSIGKGFDWRGIRARTVSDDEGVHQDAFEEAPMEERPLDFRARGIEATLNMLSKSLVAALFGTIFLLRHDGAAVWASVGGLLNNVLSMALKRILNQERPFPTLRSDPGMPSSHSQSIFYTTAFLNLSLMEWFGVSAVTTTLSGFFFIVASYFSWLRVSRRFHTLSQVIVGAALGVSFFIFWFWLWYTFVLNLFTSSLWVRVTFVLVGVGFCLAFLYNVYCFVTG